MALSLSAERARFAAEALVTLGAQVRQYCGSYPDRLEGLAGEERRAELRRFLSNARTLVSMLGRLRGMAEEIEGLQIINFEQLEAELEAARCSLADVVRLEVLRN